MAMKRGVGAQSLKIVRKYFPAVKKVSDADGPITIEVMPKDSATAAKKNHSECALAVACKRAMKADGVIVSVGTAYVIKGGVATRYKMTEHASREIVSFDRGAGFAVGTYTLAQPRNEQRLGSRSQSSRPDSGRSTDNGKKIVKRVTTNIRTVLGSDIER
jgi:hypothetical protein